MEDDLVEQRKWLTRDRYLEGLAICQTLPGPLAIQVGIYVGYICRGVLGAWAAGSAFILAPFAIVLASAYLYERFSALTLVRALFYGISPVVIALIVHSCQTLGKIALTDGRRQAPALGLHEQRRQVLRDDRRSHDGQDRQERSDHKR
jgi:chromate transporter